MQRGSPSSDDRREAISPALWGARGPSRPVRGRPRPAPHPIPPTTASAAPEPRRRESAPTARARTAWRRSRPRPRRAPLEPGVPDGPFPLDPVRSADPRGSRVRPAGWGSGVFAASPRKRRTSSIAFANRS